MAECQSVRLGSPSDNVQQSEAEVPLVVAGQVIEEGLGLVVVTRGVDPLLFLGRSSLGGRMLRIVLVSVQRLVVCSDGGRDLAFKTSVTIDSQPQFVSTAAAVPFSLSLFCSSLSISSLLNWALAVSKSKSSSNFMGASRDTLTLPRLRFPLPRPRRLDWFAAEEKRRGRRVNRQVPNKHRHWWQCQ